MTKAVQNIDTVLQEALVGKDADDQAAIDEIMIKADGSENKANLGRKRHTGPYL